LKYRVCNQKKRERSIWVELDVVFLFGVSNASASNKYAEDTVDADD
jgi:hypothetical protein